MFQKTLLGGIYRNCKAVRYSLKLMGRHFSHSKAYHYNEQVLCNRENKVRIALNGIPLIEHGEVINMRGGITNLMLG